ncbi:hypothetical protein CLOM_g12355 [Closterium sp. NIES-68]|nr:hypothetical protein CLOM_g12355 [Closterium sp. NIES-68]
MFAPSATAASSASLLASSIQAQGLTRLPSSRAVRARTLRLVGSPLQRRLHSNPRIPPESKSAHRHQLQARSEAPEPLIRALGRFFTACGAAAAGAGMENAWASEGRPAVAVVTGANKGIGFYIARGLAGQGLATVLTARDPGLGQEAAKKLQGEASGGGVSSAGYQRPIIDRQLCMLAQGRAWRLGRAGKQCRDGL